MLLSLNSHAQRLEVCANNQEKVWDADMPNRITDTLDSNSSKSRNVKLASVDKSLLQLQSGSLEAGWIVVQDARGEVAFTW